MHACKLLSLLNCASYFIPPACVLSHEREAPAMDAETSPAKGTAASPAKGAATSLEKDAATSSAKGSAASRAKHAAASPAPRRQRARLLRRCSFHYPRQLFPWRPVPSWKVPKTVRKHYPWRLPSGMNWQVPWRETVREWFLSVPAAREEFPRRLQYYQGRFEVSLSVILPSGKDQTFPVICNTVREGSAFYVSQPPSGKHHF
jgi:hypothetical protein